jgi:sugar phosphate permease
LKALRTLKLPFHYAWLIAGLTFLLLLCAAGVRSAPAVLIIPFEQEFHWSRATISLAISVNLILYGLSGPYAAAFVLRFGARRTLGLAFASLGVGVLLTILMKQPWQLILIWGLVVGTSSGLVGIASAATLVNRWFVRQRGLVIGLLSASTATGQLIFLPFLASLIEHRGWRWASLTIAAVCLLVVPLIALLMRAAPSDLGLAPFGAKSAADEPAGDANRAGGRSTLALPFRILGQAVAKRDFWLLAGSFFICGASTNGLIGTHLVPACVDAGMPEVRAAGLLAVMGIFDIVGTTCSGWLSDRLDARWLLLAYYGLRGLSLFLLPMVITGSAIGLGVFTVFYGLDWIATVPPTVQLCGRAFGNELGGLVFGWIFAAHQLGAATAAWGAGAIRVGLGDYGWAFSAAGVLCCFSALLVLFIGTGERRSLTPVTAPYPSGV